MNACQGRDVPLEVIERGLKDEDWHVRQAAMKACQGRDVPLKMIERGLKDKDRDVRLAAINACQGRDMPLKMIERGLKDKDWRVRQAVMNACQGRDVPLEVIERGLKDEDWHVRLAAMKQLEIRGIPLPLVRTFEPPETVYKKCISGVIVCASIPKDAEVRGAEGQKCRASRAVITDVIGNIAGEPVGISKHDMCTTYYTGDQVEIPDFDIGNEEGSTGFHFFCTREEAEEY
jgi:hypothetical protein